MIYSFFHKTFLENQYFFQVFCDFFKNLDTQIFGRITPSLFSFFISNKFLTAFRAPECQNFSVKVFNSVCCMITVLSLLNNQHFLVQDTLQVGSFKRRTYSHNRPSTTAATSWFLHVGTHRENFVSQFRVA